LALQGGLRVQINANGVNQYAHTAWTTRYGFTMGNIYAMAQTPDGYPWFGTGIRLVSL